jgi:hypothetical protein
MVAFYQGKIKNVKQTHRGNWLQTKDKKWVFDTKDFLKKITFLGINDEDCTSFKILKTLAAYDGRNRTGDQYVRNLFDCALLYYTDKFGHQDLDRVLIKLFVWAYSLRLNHQAIQLASADNHAISWNSVFLVIREATQPKDVYQMFLENIEIVNSTKTDGLKDMFKELRYYNGE